MYKRILVAADGSDDSIKAIKKTMELARLSDGVFVEVLFVVDNTNSKRDVLRHWNIYGLELERSNELHKLGKVAKTNDIEYKVKLLRGDPASTIIRYSEDKGFDLIVMGSRGLSGIKGLFLGSVSYKVSKRAKASILITK